MVSDDELSKIQIILKHAHLIDGSYTVQPYSKDNAFRTGILITVSKKKREIDYVFVNVDRTKFSAWMKQTWNRRKKEIALESFEVETNEPGIIRLGFK